MIIAGVLIGALIVVVSLAPGIIPKKIQLFTLILGLGVAVLSAGITLG